MKRLLFIGFLLLGMTSMANSEIIQTVLTSVNDLEPAEEWQVYNTYDGVKVEYRLARCGDGVELREQNLLLFKFTNTTNESKSISWTMKMFRDGECYNCHRIERDEYKHTINLAANESIEGDCSVETIRNQALSTHDNYIKHVPGMANTRLTNFELIDVTVR
tara:strand:- start:3193 stop:3678 length:486 start_codon:yes stop_codon:yes gene_type:complete